MVVLEGKDINNYSSKNFAKQMSVVLTEKVKTELLTCRDVVAMGRYPYTNYFGKLTRTRTNELSMNHLRAWRLLILPKKIFTDK